MKHYIKFFLVPIYFLSSAYNLNGSNFITYSADDIRYGNFVISSSAAYDFYNNMEYTYDPSVAGPMIKITGSDVILDFKNVGITNVSTISDSLVAIEIGWSPEELAADPARVQPRNITIRNVSFNKFDCSIFVHEGVKRVFFSNINVNDSCTGMVFAGTTSKVEEMKLSNISIFGDKQDHHLALEALKTLVETTFGYGADYFQKLIADPYNSNTVDVYACNGIWLNNVFTLDMKNILVKDVGYDYTTLGSAGNGNRTQAMGVVIKNSQHISLDKVVVNNIYGEINAVGLLLDNDSSIAITNSKFSFNVAGQLAAGIRITNDTAASYSVTALDLEHIEARNHISDTIVKAMDLSSLRGLMANDLSLKFNKGAYQSYGLYLDTGSTINIKDSTISENITTRLTNDVATTSGIAAYGFYGNNINGTIIQNVDFNSMQGLNSAYGVYLNNSRSGIFTTCQFAANIAVQMRSGEAADIRSQQDAQEISKHAPVVAATSTGGYGAFIVSSNFMKFENCLANSNSGHRAIGLKVSNCRSIAVLDTYVSTQSANGSMIDATFQTDNIANPYAIAIKTAHIPLFFGGDFSKTSIDAVTTTDVFLEKMSSIRASQLAGDSPSYSDVLAATSTLSLLEGMIARYRLWGVGIGIQAHNVAGFIFKNCTAAGNSSLFDSGVGLCFTGRNTDHTISDSNIVFNLGSLASLITASTNPAAQYSYSYNLMNVKPFWTTLLQTDIWTNISDNAMGSAVNSVALSPNGNYLAVGLANNDTVILNPNTGATVATLTGHTAPVTSVAFSPDGTQLATGSSSATNNIKIWETSGWTNTQTLTHISSGVNAVAWNPAGTLLASGANTVLINNLVIWNTSSWTAVTALTHGSNGVLAVAFSSDGSLLASGSADTSNNVKIWATSTWLNTHTLNFHTDNVNSVAFNPAGTLLASGSNDDLIKIVDTSSWTVSQTITASAGNVNAVAFKNDGKLLASGHGDNSVHIWSTTDWSNVKTFTDHTQPVTSVAWSADGRRIVSGSLDGSAKFYSTNIYSKATTTTQAGIYNPSVYFTAQGQKQFGNETVGNDVFVRLKSQDRALISPIGPVGGGIIMGDLLIEGVVQNSNLYGNLGNAGWGAGIILDNAYSLTLDTDLISGNIANVYGSTAGIFDRTAHTPNLFMRNLLEGNKCSIFNNSNYFVPFNPADTNDLSFPVTKMFNGKFENVTTLMDNVEVLYSQNPQFYNIEYLASVPQHPDLVSYWTANNLWA